MVPHKFTVDFNKLDGEVVDLGYRFRAPEVAKSSELFAERDFRKPIHRKSLLKVGCDLQRKLAMAVSPALRLGLWVRRLGGSHFKERIAKNAVRISRSVQVGDASIEIGLANDRRCNGRASDARDHWMPAIIAVNVFLVKPSTRSGLLESTYTIRGDTRISQKPALLRSG